VEPVNRLTKLVYPSFVAIKIIFFLHILFNELHLFDEGLEFDSINGCRERRLRARFPGQEILYSFNILGMDASKKTWCCSLQGYDLSPLYEIPDISNFW
jgi:hypothetical protein